MENCFQSFDPSFEIFEVSEHLIVILTKIQSLQSLKIEYSLLDERVGEVDVIIKVSDHHIGKVLGLKQIFGEVCSRSLALVAAVIHLLDKFYRNFQVLH